MRRRHVSRQLAAGLIAPLAARAQGGGSRMRRIGVFLGLASEDGDERAQIRLAAFSQGLQEAGWSIGRNLRIDYRWRAADENEARARARELLALGCEVVLCSSSPVTAAVLQETRSVPIVFVLVINPVELGFVDSFARPGRNVTGFSSLDPAFSGKWLEVLREIAPDVRRAAVLVDPALRHNQDQLNMLAAGAAALGLELRAMDLRDPAALETDLAAFARVPGGGMVVAASSVAGFLRERLIALAARHRLPAIYPFGHFVAAGGLAAYGPDLVEAFRLAAGYVDRILKGDSAATLPVQAPTKYELVVNLATARALGLSVPASLLARTDEVIE